MKKALRLRFDDVYGHGFNNTEYDKGTEGHTIIIEIKDKKKFLDAFTKRFRNGVEDLFEEVSVKEYNGSLEVVNDEE
jgi:hypothetical protein